MPAGEKQQLMTLIKFQRPRLHISSLSLFFFLSLMSSHAAVPLAQRFISALHLSLVRMLHFLPALLTLRENQYLLVPAGRTNSLWNSVFLRHTQSLEDATQQPLAKPLAAAAAVAASCSITAHSSKRGLGILWSWMLTEATSHSSVQWLGLHPSGCLWRFGLPMECCQWVLGIISDFLTSKLVSSDTNKSVLCYATIHLNERAKCTVATMESGKTGHGIWHWLTE